MKFNNLFMGAMGGRPGQALYFVGIQGDELIFLDPHLVQDSVSHDHLVYDEWVITKSANGEEEKSKSDMSVSKKTNNNMFKS